MKIIAKVIESMLTKDATQQWTGQTSAVASRELELEPLRGRDVHHLLQPPVFVLTRG